MTSEQGQKEIQALLHSLNGKKKKSPQTIANEQREAEKLRSGEKLDMRGNR